MLTTTIEDGIATLAIDLPGRSMNVMDWDLAAALDAEVARLAADETITGLILTSAKPAFIAGADLAVLQQVAGTAREIAAKVGEMADVFRRIETSGKPVVAAAPGTALGAGLELMLACHYRIAADAKGAVFGLPEVKLGLFPGVGGTQRLPRLIGIEAALPLMLEGNALSPAEALAAGILDDVVAPEDLLPAARRALRESRVSPVAPWDRKGFALPGGAPQSPRIMDAFSLLNARMQAQTRHLYPAPEAILACVFEGTRLPMDTALRLERKRFGALFAGPQARAMIRTLFLTRQKIEKRSRAEGAKGLLFFSKAKADAAGIEDEALVRALEQVGYARPSPIMPSDGFALYASRCMEAFIEEGLALLREGTPSAMIENCARAAGMPYGPLALARALGRAVAGGDGAAPTTPEAVKRRLIRAQSTAAASIIMRLAADHDEADLAAVLGWGFPSYLGGPLNQMEENRT
ncbi:enoyl-CoA hydratase-related protein [Aquabacter sp. CN5-332]|uniref:enoyl-CoA hydratase-related protein n=1 Tax=Aquabacter sp. CN5-332 TaxID=3156608 RepID=UPI0032B371E5